MRKLEFSSTGSNELYRTLSHMNLQEFTDFVPCHFKKSHVYRNVTSAVIYVQIEQNVTVSAVYLKV